MAWNGLQSPFVALLFFRLGGILVDARVPDKHAACPPPILVEEAVETAPHASQAHAQRLAFWLLLEKGTQPGLDALEANNVPRDVDAHCALLLLRRRKQLLSEKLAGVVVEAVRLVAVVVPLCGVGLRGQRRLAGERVRREPRVVEVGSPGRRVARHQEQCKELVCRLWRSVRGVCQRDGRGVDALVFPAEVRQDAQRGRLVQEGQVARQDEVDSQSCNEPWLVADARSCMGLAGRRHAGEERSSPRSGYDAQHREQRVDEAHFLVGYE